MTLPMSRRITWPVFRTQTVALLSVAVMAGCVNGLPPAATPESVVPAMDAVEPPTEGSSRLVVDVVEGPTPVHQVRMDSQQVDDGQGRVSWQFYESRQQLCATSPCIADLPEGNVLLGFPVLGDPGELEIELVHVGPEPSVYRRSLSVYEGSSSAGYVLGIIATVLGGAAVITGSIPLAAGLRGGDDGQATAGAITLGAGAVVLGLGLLAIRIDGPTYRPGSSTHFPLRTTPTSSEQ